MRIYHYHEVTKVYLSSSIARLSPLENDVYLIPAHATTIEPPDAIEGKVRIFDNGQWKQADIPTSQNEIPRVLTEYEKKEKQKQNILFQLASLDLVVPRIVEDIIEQGEFNIHQSKLDIIKLKKSLREQLQQLNQEV